MPCCTDTARGYWRVRIGAAARALENQCVVVQAPAVGEAHWLPAAARNHGAAAIYGPPDVGLPEDGVIASGKNGVAGWVHGEVDLADLRRIREAGTVLTFRDWADQPAALATVEVQPLGAPAEV